MREPTPHHRAYGMLAEFDEPDRLVDAVRRTRQAGFEQIDAFSPFPIDELAEALAFHDNRVPWLTLAGGVFGAALGFGMQVWMSLDYPLNIGGRPVVAPQAFVLITFELTVLFAVLAAILGMLVLNHLPRLHHPLFDVESFHLASSDKFFLVVLGNDPKFEEAAGFLAALQPLRIDSVGHTEEPE